ncbi:hypothetical protein EJB05_34059, partial [Eragrostis curvula]
MRIYSAIGGGQPPPVSVDCSDYDGIDSSTTDGHLAPALKAQPLPNEPHVQPREILSPSAGGELFLHSIFETIQDEILPFDVTEEPSLACDEAVAPFIVAAERVRLPQVEDELVLQGGDTLYKSLISSQVMSLAITHASFHQYTELC